MNTPPVLTAIDGSDEELVNPTDGSAPPVVLVSPSIQALGGGGLSSIFPALLGAGAAVAVFGHNGSNSNGSTPLTPVVPPVASVPEASTEFSFGLLLAGGAFLLASRRKTPVKSA